jgi:uncharacterized protein (DUF1015 family)
VATLQPFRALRPTREQASAVSAVPYDVVSTAEARELARGSPLSFLHVSRPEIDLPDGTNPYSTGVYNKAAESYVWLKTHAQLVTESYPALYVYRLRMGKREQTGVAGVVSVDEYDTDVIRKHERTRPDKEDDRTRHMLALAAQTGPVFLTYRGRAEIEGLLAKAKKSEPLIDFTAKDRISHTIWRLSEADSALLSRIFRLVPNFYIADGHHRAASAARARTARKNANPSHTGSEDYNFFLAVAFPASQVRILAYNRVVKDLNGRSPETFLAELSKRFAVRSPAPKEPTGRRRVSIYLARRWHGLTLPSPVGHGALTRLDADLLQDHVLDPLLGIRDVRTDKRIDFVGGIRGTEELERLVDEGKASVAFSMYPVSVAELMAVADAGQIMPPKSTWFEPKLRDGLLIHLI